MRVPGWGRVTGKTRILSGTDVARPSAVTVSDAAEAARRRPYGTST